MIARQAKSEILRFLRLQRLVARIGRLPVEAPRICEQPILRFSARMAKR
jgi:hypothetical protein